MRAAPRLVRTEMGWLVRTAVWLWQMGLGRRGLGRLVWPSLGLGLPSVGLAAGMLCAGVFLRLLVRLARLLRHVVVSGV